MMSEFKRHLTQWWPVWAYGVTTLTCSLIYWRVPCGMFQHKLDWFEALYFSLITSTTLGYGDIVPVHWFTRSLAAIQALSGPIYLAFFVSNSLYKKQVDDGEKARKKQAQLLYSQLYVHFDRFLSEIATRHPNSQVTISFPNGGQLISTCYSAERSDMALNQPIQLEMKYRKQPDDVDNDFRKSLSESEYGRALANLSRDIARFASLDLMISQGISLDVGTIYYLSRELVLDIERPPSGIPVELVEDDNLFRLNNIELEVYKLLANIEREAAVEVSEEVDFFDPRNM